MSEVLVHMHTPEDREYARCLVVLKARRQRVAARKAELETTTSELAALSSPYGHLAADRIR